MSGGRRGCCVRVVQVAGLVEYNKAWAVQKLVAARVAEEAKRGEPPHTLILLQHKPVYTVGIRSSEYSSSEESRLRSLGADFVRSNRGGLITFQGPGQLTVYPILHLAQMRRTIKWYVCALERTIIRACRQLQVETHTSPHTGVWVNDTAKICAIGIQGRRVTTHGIALNCNTDLAWFDHIVPCGIPETTVTSLSRELQRQVTVAEAVPHFVQAFAEVFECHLQGEDTELEAEQFERGEI